MRKKLFFTFLIMLFPLLVNAKEVTSFEEVKTNNVANQRLEFTGSTLKLTEDINLVAYLDIKANTTLDLNGYTLTLGDHGNNYAVAVFDTLTINGDGTVKVIGNFGVTTSVSGSPKIVINGGTFNQVGDYYMFGITNGELVINDGTFTAPYCVANSLGKATMAAYPSVGEISSKITIKGGTFSTNEGEDAPIMNSDIVIIDGGAFTSSGEGGMAVYTDPTGETTINKGTFSTTGADASTIYNEGTTTIYDGVFESTGDALVNDTGSNQDAKIILIGGNYTDSENYVAPFVDDQSVHYTDASGNSQVILRDNLVQKAFVSAITIGEQELALVNNAKSQDFELGNSYDVQLWLVNPTDNAKIEQVRETTKEVDVTLDVSSLPKVSEGLTREFEVVRLHEGSAEVLKAKDNGNGTIIVKSNKFSTYTVTYKDSKNTQNREANENNGSSSTTKAANPKTGDAIILFVVMMVLGLTGVVVTTKKLANR